MNAPTKKNVDWTKIDTPLEHMGKKIVLPGDPTDMSYDAAIATLQRVKAAEAQVYSVHEVIGGALPWDSFVATFMAMQEMYGVVLPQTTKSWFGDRNPAFLTVRTGPNPKDLIQVPMGQIVLPGMTNPIIFSLDQNGAYISGTVTKKEMATVVDIAVRARKILSENSIYKGKSIRLRVTENGGALDVSMEPEFFDVRGVHETDMIHNETTAKIIRTSIHAPIKHTEACKRNKIPLKRGILLEGKYGTGKTLTARVTAKVAIDNGWTFIVLSHARGLQAALKTAEMYQPAVVFAEDIDRFGDRSQETVNDLINLMDGLVKQGSAIMTVLTTNHVELIDKALLRPGRLDAVISIDPPDAATVEKLIRHYGGAELPEDVSLVRTGELLSGQIPATVAEIVKRAKLSMLTEDRTALVEDDLVTAAESMNRHMALLADIPTPKSRSQKLGDAVASVIEAQVEDLLGEQFKEKIQDIYDRVV